MENRSQASKDTAWGKRLHKERENGKHDHELIPGEQRILEDYESDRTRARYELPDVPRLKRF